MEQQTWTIQSILEWTHRYFKDHGIDTPRLDAELLLAKACHCTRMDLYLTFDKPLAPEERDSFRALVKQRLQGKPVAYLLGEKDFWTLTLEVKEGVLIPRPDTETLVETTVVAIREWQASHPDQPCRLLELGTGTAAIPLSLCHELQNLSVLTIDISPIAIQVASQNILRYPELLEPRSNTLQVVQGYCLEMLHPEAQFDFIVSNPPYIPTTTIALLQRDVTLHEPHVALDGGEDGLAFYRYLFAKSAQHLAPSGQMLLEMGYDQGPALESLLPSHLKLLQIVHDLQDHPRALHVTSVTAMP